MATMKPNDVRLLVVREAGASLPKLDELGGATCDKSLEAGFPKSPREHLHENVTVVAQFSDESPVSFAERVRSRLHREGESAVTYRGIVLAMNLGANRETAMLRGRLVQELARVLASNPDGTLLLQAPRSADAVQRAQLFDLVEATARSFPRLRVNLSFESVPLLPPRKVMGQITGLRLSV
ncbi:MAG: hypothetical protein QM784_26565 [Polyangiaceae bacterium]